MSNDLFYCILISDIFVVNILDVTKCTVWKAKELTDVQQAEAITKFKNTKEKILLEQRRYML